MSESHSSATATGPLTGHRVRFDGRDALCGSLENGSYRIRFERTGHSLLVTPRALEDLGEAHLYIDQKPQLPDRSSWVEVPCAGTDHDEATLVLTPPLRPAETVRCATCVRASMKRHADKVEAAEAKRKAARKARHIAKDKREPRRDRSAFSKTYGPLSNW